MILGIAAGAVLVAAYAAIPRHADLRAFDPAEMARLETAMWRDYYDKRYAALFYHLYEVNADPVRLLAVSEPAYRVQCRRGGPDVPADTVTAGGRCGPPALVAYYRDFAPAAPVTFDVEEAARLELDWWQARREAVGPQDYGLTIAHVTALTYGGSVGDAGIRQFGIARAAAMAYRDARGEGITEGDWAAIEARLAGAYRSLKASVTR